MSQHVVTETAAGVTAIRMNRPDKKNALTVEMYEVMARAVADAEKDPAVKVIRFEAAGETFSAGNDLADFMQRPPTGPDSPVFAFLTAIATARKPLVAAVDGLGVGIGLTMLLHCDLVYASDRAKFRTPFVDLGLVPEAASSLIMPRLSGRRAAARHILLGEPFTARQALERTDRMVARLVEAQRAVYPDSTIAVVSDHGFHRVDATVNLNAAFAQAGLIELDPEGRLASWKAYAWNSGGSASVVLKDKADIATRDAVDAILTALEQDPDSGVASVLRGEAAVQEGALEEASFMVDAKGGWALGGALTGDVVRRQERTTGAHGYRNTHPEMNASFFVVGPGVRPGKNLGRIDIRQIAPTLADALGVSLPTATQAPLPLGR